MAEKLFLIDGSALFYRSYFAFIRNPLINSKGENTSVTYGFLSSLVRLLEDENPQYLCVVFDTKEPTFRHQLYPEYKANRQKMPDDMSAQYPRLIDTLKRLNFNLLELDGYEADDIMGTLAHRLAGSALDVYIVSGDKDMAQLVNDHVFLYNQGKGNLPPEVLDSGGVKQKMGIRPDQIIDWLVLMGDSSDNIPGIPKVGKVTAVNLLQEYDSLEGIYEHLDEINKNVVRENLRTYREQTNIAKKLATIHLDVPLNPGLEDLCFIPWNANEADMILKELEFRRLFNRMLNIARNEGTAESFTAHDEQQVDYRLIDNYDKLDDVIQTLKKQDYFVFDLETSSLDFLTAKIAGIALAWQEKQACYIPLNHPDKALDEKKVLGLLKPIFENSTIKKIAQNIKFDALILKQHSVQAMGLHFDTMIAAYLINPSGQHKLDKLAEYYLNYEMIHIEELIGKGREQKKMTDLPASQVVAYAAEDADIELRLYHILKKKIFELGMEELFYELEMPLVDVLMDMEENGVSLDTGLLKELSKRLEKDNETLRQKIFAEAGEEFNLNSPQQLGVILFDKLQIHKELGINRPKRTKTGQYSTAESVLERYSEHPVIEDILNYRKFTKLKNTYIDILPNLISPLTGCVHTSYNQAVTATGRLSSSDPNLQNIPIRTEVGREIRRAFIPREKDWLMLSADYSQIELRIMAHLSGDQNMQESFHRNLDIHSATAAQIFDIPIDEVSSDQRRKAKEINFGIMYGMSRFGLAARLHISNAEAEQFIAEYMATYPGVDLFMRNAIAQARDKGYVETMLHRRRYLPDIHSANHNIRQFAERTAINTPIQGSAADLIKKAMIDIHHYLQKQKLPVRMLLQVHDELVFSVHKDLIDSFSKEVKKMMEQAWQLSVPVVVDTGIGNNWLEAHD